TATVAVSLDIEKAFDTTWFEGLILKLRNFGYPRTLCSIAYQFLKDRTFQVRVHDKLSETFRVSAGVPQGSKLGPKLYNIYTVDAPAPPDGKVKRLCYADDLLIYTHSRIASTASRRLNSYLARLGEYFTKWKIKINANKIVAIALAMRHPLKYPEDLDLRFGNERIPIQDSMKYLGVHFTPKMNFVKHVSETRKKVIGQSKYLHNALRHSNLLSPQIKTLCYKQLLRPIIAYAFPIYSCMSSSQMEKLRILERKTLRRCINYERRLDGTHHPVKYLYEQANTPRLDDFLISIGLRYLDRIRDTENQLVRNSCLLNPQLVERLRIKPPQYLENFRDIDDDVIPLYNRGFRDPAYRVYL
ncbi:reverse transcriptase, partial [Lasius niger]